MSIQWFPGHMNAARKKAAESMEKVDLVIEVLPTDIRYETRFKLSLRPRDDSEAALVERAEGMRESLRPPSR